MDVNHIRRSTDHRYSTGAASWLFQASNSDTDRDRQFAEQGTSQVVCEL